MVIGLPPDQGLAALADLAKVVPFLAIGIPGLSETENLSVVGPLGSRPDVVGFLSGFVSAIVTEDWRVGVIGRSDTKTGQAAIEGFLNGARYYCGICRPAFPPYLSYPIQIDLTEAQHANAWQQAVSILSDAAVRTVYVSPGIDNPSLLSALAERGILLIGSYRPEGVPRTNWIATIREGPEQAVLDLWTDLMLDRGGFSVPIPIIVEEIEVNVFSVGRQRLAEEILEQVFKGFIDTGVNPTTDPPD
jgi:hypothetical protein